jgi:ApbE superfamily uncharacterized protein (UPF0280 family)
MSAIAALLPDGRLHLQHGPIDCLCRAWGDAAEVRAAYGQAARFFDGVLDGLCAEFPLLRSALPGLRPEGAIARAMHAACMPFACGFITPMAAVAGAVADAVLAAMARGRDVRRAFVNNGGDIAFHLAPGQALRCGLVTDLALGLDIASGARVSGPVADARAFVPVAGARVPVPAAVTAGAATVPDAGSAVTVAGAVTAVESPAAMTVAGSPQTFGIDGTVLLTSDRPSRGLATSGRACKGRGGRSFSFGIADSVSILACTAAQADAAATIVGNAVDLPRHPAIDRRPASDIDPASDLGDRLVTFDVGPLSDADIDAALDAGGAMADRLIRDGLIDGAVLALRGRVRVRHRVKEFA